MGLRAHWFQHVPFEGLGSIEQWLISKRARVSSTRFFDRPVLPSPDDLDLLIIMGGSMSVNEEQAYPWLKLEKEFVAPAIHEGKAVLGICFGAQLIASALGARVRRGTFAEIGWFPVERVTGGSNADGLEKSPGGPAVALPRKLEAFHWHGETFDLPPGALHVARSEACENQAFTLGGHVLALQFHLETTSAAAEALVENCRGDLFPGPYVQPESAVLGTPDRFQRINSVMESVLDSLISAR